MARYGRTWWGKKWLEAFTGIDYSNRLERGRTYANTGRARDILINGSTITAKVQGSMPKPYKVVITVYQFSQRDKNAVRRIISDSPALLSALINKRLPEQLLEKLQEPAIKLFPTHWKEIQAKCTCPDSAVPCKHIAAVIYLVGAEIDKNPFVVFQIHDCDLLSLINDFSEGKLERALKILSLEDIFKAHRTEKSALESTFDQAALDAISFSKIPNLAEHIIGILKDDPPFYSKNFRDILFLVYKQWQKYPNGTAQKRLSVDSIAAKDTIKQESLELREAWFSKRWEYPEQWDHFQCVAEGDHHLTQVYHGKKTLVKHTDDLVETLVTFLRELPHTMLHKLNIELRFMHMLFQYAVKLMESSAVIPQILHNKNGTTLIRWIPALFDPEVKQIFMQLCAICPHSLVRYKKTALTPEEQVKTAFSFIVAGLMRDNLPSSLDSQHKYDVFKLFFMQKQYTFTDFVNKELPAALNQWLSNLYISDQKHDHTLFLVVEDRGDEFTLKLKVSFQDFKKLVSLKEALKITKGAARLALLSNVSLIAEYIPSLEASIDSDTRLSFHLEQFTPLFLEIIPVLKALGIVVMLPKSLQRVVKPRLNLTLKSKNHDESYRTTLLHLDNLLDFEWHIAVGSRKITITEFKKLLAQSRHLVKVIDEYVLLDEKEIAALLKQFDKLPTRLSQSDLMQAVLAGELDQATVTLDRQLTKLFDEVKKAPDEVEIPYNLNAYLRPYQERGFHWLVQNIEMGFGSILADDMGLGKTLQVITTILHFRNERYLDGFQGVLVVAPTSLLSNWQKEIERFAPELKVHVYHGQKRELIYSDYDVVITSYGLARRDNKVLNQIKWFLMVIDEAQNIKNPHAEQTKAIKSLNAQHKIAMSGTPVENRLLEYWSIFDFTNKHYLGTPTAFKERYALPIENERDKACLERFKKVTSPFILRRLKSDKKVIQDLPDKIESNRYCSLTAEQAALYQEVVDLSVKKIEQSKGIERKGLVFKLINSLKQVCNHPAQFGKQAHATIEQSGKMAMLEEILLEVENLAEKSLIFTQYTEMGEIIARLLGEKGKTPVPFLHGGLSIKMRDKMVDDFQNSPSVRTLIVSLKAGGIGLNLTAASHVIHYDLWWNPAVEAQATDRAYRIGQKRKVMVHRLLTTDTFEERIDEMIKSKKELANLAVDSSESWITEMTTDQLKDLIKLRKVL